MMCRAHGNKPGVKTESWCSRFGALSVFIEKLHEEEKYNSVALTAVSRLLITGLCVHPVT